jgi:putative iron-regulated protein
MKSSRRWFPLLAGCALALVGAPSACSSTTSAEADAGVASSTLERETVKGYATLVHETYAASLASAKVLKAAVDAFTAAPSQATLDAAKKAWTDARPAYVQTEAFRFYGGPIDGDDGNEGALNAWPLDEAYIDYVQGNEGAGIVNDTARYPRITKELLLELNEKDGEKNISTGWHAIEFLLWGQDTSEAGPGNRPFSDYLETGGTAKNQARRKAYLTIVTELLVEHLEGLEKAWRIDDPSSYGAKMVDGDTKAALGNILKGIGALGGVELSRERMNTAYETKDPEEEHSCFSDTTVPIDHLNDVVSIENVYLGTFGGKVVSGGLSKLVASKDPVLDAKMRDVLARSHETVAAIPAPFDTAILGDDSAPGRKKLKAAIDATKQIGAVTVDIASALGTTINLEE